jgi:hypothetical protein
VSEVGKPAGLKRAKDNKISKVNKSRQDKPQQDSLKGQSPVSGVWCTPAAKAKTRPGEISDAVSRIDVGA